MAFCYKNLILAVLLLSSEIISFVLDRIGGSNRLFLEASIIFSAIGFLAATVPAVTRSESERQLIAVDIVFSLIQLVFICIQLIRVFLGAKSNNESLLPLAFAVISVVFVFRNNEEAHVFSDLASVNQIIFRNNEEAQVLSDSASVNQIIVLETPAVDDESAINQESSTLRQRTTSTRFEISYGEPTEIPVDLSLSSCQVYEIPHISSNQKPSFTVSKFLTIHDITAKFALPSNILQHIPIPQDANFVGLQVKDSIEQVWTFLLYIRRHRYPAPVFTRGWLDFVRAKRLQVGDKLSIYLGQDGELRIKIERKSNVTFQEETVYLDVESFL